MISRIEVALKPDQTDARGRAVAAAARSFADLPVDQAWTRVVYKVVGELTATDRERVRQALTDPVIEESALGALALPSCDWVVRVGFRPGVTDNVGRTAALFIADLLRQGAPSADRSDTPAVAAASVVVHTEALYLLRATGLRREQVERLARELLANPLIERIAVWSADDYRAAPVDLDVPRAGDSREPHAERVALPADDAGLQALSRERTLALSLDEMRAIRAHYADPAVRTQRQTVGLPADPTDVELECLAQTWSEHCKHKIFNATIRYTDEHGQTRDIRSLFKSYIVEATRQIGQRVDWLVSVFHDNAGVVRVSPDTNLVFKVETHNSPSALDPYGGAITGIVGVNRDPFGTGMGAELLTNTWGYCFGPPHYDGALPAGLLHPRRIRDGVHQGVIDGGNQSGIPYSRGFEIFDERFLGKPLVFCGTVGRMPATVNGVPGERKQVLPGDIVVMVGGRIGKDGIHGATFSSEALHQESPAQAVQIGDPITQKMMTDMLLEARQLGLYRTLTDNGAGGLSSSVGEMAGLSGGAELDLARAPLKYSGLMPWEILLSEAQERMTLAVPPESLPQLLALARRREVEATAIGQFTADGFFRLRHGETVVGELPLSFLHDGCPVMQLEAQWVPPASPELSAAEVSAAQSAADALLLELVGSLNLCAKVDKCRQYDHEVKGLSVIKPLVGVQGDVPADATVMRIAHGQDRGLLLSEAIAPRLSDLDPGAMAAYVVDLALRRIVAAGGRLGQIAALDNFCWPDPVQSAATPDGKQKLAGLVRCCETLFEQVCALDLPLISGKDSMKNDSVRGGVKISIPPTLLLSTLGWMDDVSRALDLVLPRAGLDLCLLGVTRGQLGGAEICTLLSKQAGGAPVGGSPPRARAAECRAVCAALQQAADEGLVLAAHALHAGGLAVGAATLALASGWGLEIDLDALPCDGEKLSPLALLFAETPSRLLVGLDPAQTERLAQICALHGAPFARCGQVNADPVLRLRQGGGTIVDLALEQLRVRYRGTLRER